MRHATAKLSDIGGGDALKKKDRPRYNGLVPISLQPRGHIASVVQRKRTCLQEHWKIETKERRPADNAA